METDKKEIEELKEEIKSRLNSNCGIMEDKNGQELFCIPKKHYEDWIKSFLEDTQ